MPRTQRRIALVAILSLAALLRLTWLDAGDVISDEALYGFRSLGYIDYLAAPDQPTTWERLSWPVPWWAYLSFHDHPPMVFLVQHASLSLFGAHAWALRLPSALAGILVVLLAHLTVRRLADDRAGLWAALLFAVATPLVWVSRLGLQESLVILWSMLAVYGYVRVEGVRSAQRKAGGLTNPELRASSFELRNPRWYLLVGLALGLGLLTKYTILVVVLALGIHLLWFRRAHLRSAWLWWGGGVFLLCSLPVVVYNLMLYGATGHVDLQFSFLLGQDVAEWRSLPGKAEIGSLGHRLRAFAGNFFGSASVGLLVMLIGGLAHCVWQLTRRRDERTALAFLLVGVWGVSLVALGPSTRFLAPLFGWLLFAAATSGVLRSAARPLRLAVRIAVTVAVAGEAVYATNTVLASRPVGARGVGYSAVLRTDVERWGYQALDAYLGQALAGKRPALQPEVSLPFLKQLQAQATQAAERRGDQPVALLIVYDANLYNLGALWTLHRRLIYDGWPIITADRYLSQPEAAWKAAGVREILFVELGAGMLAEPNDRQSDAAQRLSAMPQVGQAKKYVLMSQILLTPAFAIRQWSLR